MKHKVIINIDNNVETLDMTGQDVKAINKIISNRKYRIKVRAKRQEIAAKSNKNLNAAKKYLN